MTRSGWWFVAAIAIAVPPWHAALAQTGLALPGQIPGPGPTLSRQVRMTQIDPANREIGKPTQIACPATGCQAVVSLHVHGHEEPFLLSVQFVASGAYVTLAPRSIGTAEVLDFDQGRKGAIFVPLRPLSVQQVRLAFVVVRSPTLEALAPPTPGQVLASGNVFHSKRSPDLMLRVEFTPTPH